MKRVFDCFIFYNEQEMVKYRLAVLNESVDVFVIVESAVTFIGTPKPFVFDYEYYNTLYPGKIEYVQLSQLKYAHPDIKTNQQWDNEHFQRDSIMRGMYERCPTDDDIILLTDVDEIHDPKCIKELRDTIQHNTVCVLKQKYHSYNLNIVRDLDWYHPKAFTYATYMTLQRSLSEIRMFGITQHAPIPLHLMEKGGWHLSYFGDVDFIQNKIQQFSHQEFNVSSILNASAIAHRIQNGRDIMDRDTITYKSIPIRNNFYLPPEYNEHLQTYIIY
uniref:Glycosyltransferase family 17 n=1 Tax=viral metagenome TaxID=1070528 RepID=A0A6C0CRZ0_9ZZZZ